ncbi:MAG: c-type cytochrome [Deltaproteobacteria bacterium]|nr:MAG: c-type cytochrome [Deltaproteobacteria bacterium]
MLPSSRRIVLLLALAALALAPGEASRSEAASAGSAEADAARGWAPESGETAQALRILGDPRAGARTYETCAVCHGEGGSGRADGTFPAIAGQHTTVILKQLVDMRAGRRRNPVMEPHVRALVDARELADVAAYIATLPPPPDNGKGMGDAEALAEGARLYARDCTGCHGARAEGDAARFVPALAGQHYAYLLRQVRAIAGTRQRDAHPVMAETVAAYRDAELRAVLDYVSRLKRTPPEASARP